MSSKLTFLTDPEMLQHKTGLGHPERPIRLKTILNWLDKTPNIDKSNVSIIKDENLNKLLEKVHERQLLKAVENSQYSRNTYFDADSIASEKTYNSALIAAGLAATSAIKSTWKHSYFATVRPPGHHATPSRAMGFCFYNNIAIATQSYLNQHKKVAIIDFDFHYGNGTADIFYLNPDVLYLSTHADPTTNYPNQGFIDEIGEKDGQGFNIPIPLSFGAGDKEVANAIENLAFPIIDDFNPDIIAVSAGFDAYVNDPVGGGYLQITPNGFKQIGSLLFNFARSKKIPIFHTLEGGYNVEMLPVLIQNYVSAWLDPKDQITQYKTVLKNDKLRNKEKQTFTYVKQMLKDYWQF